jgi:hypothetical protein
MPSRKASKKALKTKRWVPKKGWIVKKVKNPAVFMAMPGYPALSCPKCLFYPCYADAYGSYRCPRCGKVWQGSAPAMKGRVPKPPPSKICPCCQYYPCWCIDGVCRCPHCRTSFHCTG